MGYGIDASTERFEAVTVLNHPMLFTCLRVNRDTVPKGLYIYEVRHDDDMQGDPVQISDSILVNHWGTLLSTKPIHLEQHPTTSRLFRDIDPEQDWNYEGYEMTVKEYLEEHAPKKEKHKFPER